MNARRFNRRRAWTLFWLLFSVAFASFDLTHTTWWWRASGGFMALLAGFWLCIIVIADPMRKFIDG